MTKKLTLVLSALSLVIVPGCTLSTDFDGYFTADSGQGGDVDGGRRDGGGEPMDADLEDAGADDASRDAPMGDVLDLDAPGGNVLTVEKLGEGAGIVTSDVAGIDCGTTCSAPFAAGTMVTLTVAPDTNSTLVGWSEPSCDDASLTCEVTMDMARTVQVTLDLRQVRLTVTRSGDGSGGITSSDGQITCDGSAAEVCTATYTTGASVTLNAMATGTSVFAGWSGACSGTGACTFTLTDDAAVGAAFDRDQRSLSVTVTGAGTGGVTSAPAGIDCGLDCSESYDLGTMVTLTATPASDSTFTGWSGACSGTGTCMVTMSAARMVTATFALRRYTLTVVRDGTGTGSVISTTPLGLINCGATCSAMRDHGSVVVLEASAGVGSSFSGWSGGGCDPTTPVCLVTLTADTTVTANFAIDQHTVSVSYASSGDGTGTVTSTPAGVSCTTGGATGCVGTFNYNTMVTLNATPAVGSEFVQWSGACAGTAASCVVTTTTDRTVTAEIRRRRYTVTVSTSGAGMGSVSGGGISCPSGTCSAMVAHGDTITLSAAPNAGSTFAGWGGACASSGSSATCTIPITAATSVSATFTLGTNVLTVTRNGSGTVTSAPSGIDCGSTCAASFTTGTMITLTATPATGYTFSGWSNGPCAGTGTCSVSMGLTPIGVTATFVPMRFTLTTGRTGTGMGSISSDPAGITCPPMSTCAADYDYGTLVTLTATPSTGSTFTGWSGAPSGSCTTTGPCTVTMTQARSITAAFALNTYSLDVVREGGGNGTVSSSPAGISCGTDCDQVYSHGQVVRLTATPATGSNFAGWTGGGCGTTSPCDVTLTAATTVRARFELNRYTLQITKLGMGTVVASDSSINCGPVCSAQYDHGSSVTLSATPATGFRFGGWSGGGCTGTGSCVVSMTAAQNVTATFVQRVTVTVQPTSPVGGRDAVVTSSIGSIRCFANGSATGCSDTFDAGTSITLTASPPAWASFDGWSGVSGCSASTCTFTPSASTTVTARFTQLGNLAFVSSSTHLGDLGGQAGADAICTGLARNAGLPDVTYRAWVSTTTVDAGSAARGIVGSNGHVRPDGLPVSYQGSDFTNGGLRHPILLDENGINVGAPLLAWTGTEPDGTVGAASDTCSDWTSNDLGRNAIVGHVERGAGEWTAAQQGAAVPCSVARRLYCFGTGSSFSARTPAAPPANAGYFFVSSATFDGAATVTVMDQACRNEAVMRSFPNATDYVAFVSSPSQTAAGRVSFAGPFYRPDGWLIGDTNQVLTGMPRLSTFPTQRANGAFVFNQPGWDPFFVWTGFAQGSPGGTPNGTSTCSGWSANTLVFSGQRGVPAATSYNRWGQADTPGFFCSQRFPVYCIRSR